MGFWCWSVSGSLFLSVDFTLLFKFGFSQKQLDFVKQLQMRWSEEAPQRQPRAGGQTAKGREALAALNSGVSAQMSLKCEVKMEEEQQQQQQKEELFSCPWRLV